MAANLPNNTSYQHYLHRGELPSPADFNDYLAHVTSKLTAPTIGYGIVLIYFLWTISHAFLGPLRYIPGPWYAMFTTMWLKKHTLSGRRMHYIHKLHEKYGDVVRIGPNEVDVSNLQGFQEIHKIGKGFLKSPWYQDFRTGETPDLFSLLDPKEHSLKRKLMARPFSNTSLRQNWELIVTQHIKTAVENMKKEGMDGNGTVDIFKWWTFMATDVVGHIAFGESFGMIESGKKSPFIHDLESAIRRSGIRAEIAPMYDIINFFTFGLLDRLNSTDARVQQYGYKAVAATRGREMGKANIMQAVIEESRKENSPMSDYAAAFEAASLIVAGSGTTAVTLTYLVWAVLSNPVIQKNLEEEIAKLGAEFNNADLEALPYLSAVISEALRLYCPAPGSLPRIVPSSGFKVSSYFIPPKTTVCTQAYTLHRDPTVFESPERFEPERFLRPEGLTPRQKAALCAFGAGSRTCIGMHLAYMELRHAVAYFFRICAGAKLAPTMSAECMEFAHFFVIAPRGGRCEITVK